MAVMAVMLVMLEVLEVLEVPKIITKRKFKVRLLPHRHSFYQFCFCCHHLPSVVSCPSFLLSVRRLNHCIMSLLYLSFRCSRMTLTREFFDALSAMHSAAATMTHLLQSYTSTGKVSMQPGEMQSLIGAAMALF
jgi:hypothetical protein